MPWSSVTDWAFVAGASEQLGASLCLPAELGVLAAPLPALAAALPSHRRRAQAGREVHDLGSGRGAAAAAHERVVRNTGLSLSSTRLQHCIMQRALEKLRTRRGCFIR